MSVSRTTIEETMRKLQAGDWEHVGAIDQYRHGGRPQSAHRLALHRVHRRLPARPGRQSLRGKEVRAINQ